MSFQMFKLDLEKAEEPVIKLPNLLDHWKSKRIPEKNIYFCFIDYTKTFDCVDHNKLWEILQEIETPDTLPASWEICVQIKKQQLEQDMEQQTYSKLGKEYIKAVGCILSSSLFNLYAEYIIWNARLDESQAEIEIARRNINNINMQMTPP